MKQQIFSIDIRTDNRILVSLDTFCIENRKIMFLFGESGIGKSMIAKALYGLLDPHDLHIRINGKEYVDHLSTEWISQIQKNSFFVFQEPSSHLNPILTIKEQLGEGSLKETRFDEDILHYLWQNDYTSLPSAILPLYPLPYRPSGGEKQRILISMAFKKILLYKSAGKGSTFFVFDEPSGSLDNTYRNLMLSWLYEQFQIQPFTLLFITHDYSILSQIYEHHSLMVPYTVFKQLTRRQDNKVLVEEFSPTQYFDWIRKKRILRENRSIKADPIAEIKGNFSIFSRNYQIFTDNHHLNKTDMIIRNGDMVYLKAPSGVGKTSFAKCLMGLYIPDSFSCTIKKIPLTEKTPRFFWYKNIWGKTATMVFQHADEALNLQSTVKQLFQGLKLSFALNDPHVTRLFSTFFGTQELDMFFKKQIYMLSGGQKQRLNILRSLFLKTDLVILDEPLNGLDFASIHTVLSLLQQRRAEGGAFLVISHNEEIFESIIDKESIYYLAIEK